MFPTERLAFLFTVPLLPAVLAIAFPSLVNLALALDGLLLAAFLIDGRRCPPRESLDVTRSVEQVVSAGAPNTAKLRLENVGAASLRGEVVDSPPKDSIGTHRRMRFDLAGFSRVELPYVFRPLSRGDHRFGDVFVRVLGPWGLAHRQHVLPAARTVKAYPDLTALSGRGLSLLRPDTVTGLAHLRRSLGEGREFESLREYIPGDDVRSIDWKATAKRQRPIARQYEPERNQTVVLLVDCGRHMVSRVGERTKLDWAIDAALRLAQVSLDRGDLVGLCAFGASVKGVLPARKGRSHLRAMVELLYPLKPELVESDYGAAFDAVVSRTKRRAMIATFTDLLDEDSSRAVLARTMHLRPRHLPVLVAVADTSVAAPAREIPADEASAFRRAAARKIVRERELSVARLRDAGALVVSANATELSAAAVNQYLEVKRRGLL
jgi:uncharacterized protein (DUF58 family)